MKTRMNSSNPLPSPRTSDRPTAIAAKASAGQRRAMLISLWLLASIAVAFIASSTAVGQQYKQLPYADAYKLKEFDGAETAASKRANRAIYTAIKDGTKSSADSMASGDPSQAITFFNEYVLPSMTRTNANAMSTLGEKREAFVKDFLDDDVRGGPRKTFIAAVIKSLQGVAASKDFHPAARINAVYLLGLLDDDAGTRDTAPTPSSEAFNSLIKVMSAAQLPDSLKVAASSGIERHLQLARAGNGRSLDPADVNQASKIALAILSDSAPGQAKWAPDLSYWLKRRSVKILATAGQSGNNAEVIAVLTKILTDETPEHLLLGYDAMTALPEIDLSGASPEAISEVTAAVTGYLARSLTHLSATAKADVEHLTFKNLLLEDLDLEVKGNDYSEEKLSTFASSKNRPTRSTAGAGRGSDRGMDDMGMGMDEMDMDMGMDMDMDMDMGRGGGGGARSASSNRRAGAPQLELPNYELNRIRGLIKALAYGGKQTLAGGSKSLQSVAAPDDKAVIDEVTRELTTVIADANVGIIDLQNPPEMEDEDLDEDPPSNTEQMIELCERASSRLAAIVRENSPAAAADAPADAANASAEAGDGALFN